MTEKTIKEKDDEDYYDMMIAKYAWYAFVLCFGILYGIFYAVNNTPKMKIGDALYELEQTYPSPEYSGHEIIQYKKGKLYKSWYRGQ